MWRCLSSHRARLTTAIGFYVIWVTAASRSPGEVVVIGKGGNDCYGSLYVHRLLRNPGNQPERQLGNDRPDISLFCSALPSRQSGHRRSIYRFSEIVEAHNTLKDPVKRAQYDIQHKNHSDFRWKLAEEASDSKGIERDVDIQDKLLSILYVKRRQNINDPGIGDHELERLSGCPREHLEFHLWYLKEKGWIGRTRKRHARDHRRRRRSRQFRTSRKTTTKLLTDQNHTSQVFRTVK